MAAGQQVVEPPWRRRTGAVALNRNYHISFERPEAWGLKYFASVSLLSGLPAPPQPEESHVGTVTLSLEMDWLPQLNAGQQRIGFDGTVPEGLNKAPIFARPVIRVQLPHKFVMLAAAPPPFELFGVRTHLLAFGVERPLVERGPWTIGWRGYGQVGSVKGAFTCPDSVLGFASGSARESHQLRRPIGGRCHAAVCGDRIRSVPQAAETSQDRAARGGWRKLPGHGIPDACAGSSGSR